MSIVSARARSLAWLAGMLAGGLPGLARRFSGFAGGVPGRLTGFAGGVVGFDRGLTRYFGFAEFAGFVL